MVSRVKSLLCGCFRGPKISLQPKLPIPFWKEMSNVICTLAHDKPTDQRARPALCCASAFQKHLSKWTTPNRPSIQDGPRNQIHHPSDLVSSQTSHQEPLANKTLKLLKRTGTVLDSCSWQCLMSAILVIWCRFRGLCALQ